MSTLSALQSALCLLCILQTFRAIHAKEDGWIAINSICAAFNLFAVLDRL